MINFQHDILPLKNLIFRTALRIVLNREEAEDIVQDTLMKLWQKRDELAQVANLEAFALASARNLAIDRKEKMENRNISLDDTLHDRPDEGLTEGDRLMTQQETHRLVADVINSLPDFHLPTVGSIGRHIWFRVSDFLQKITTVVLVASIIIWFLEFFPAQDLDHIETSYLATIGKWLEPVMRPLGFDWKLTICLLTGVPAKEAIAATFAILYPDSSTLAAISTPTAFAFLTFTLLYFPCVATTETLRRETNWKWATFSAVFSILLAWVMAFLVALLFPA